MRFLKFVFDGRWARNWFWNWGKWQPEMTATGNLVRRFWMVWDIFGVRGCLDFARVPSRSKMMKDFVMVFLREVFLLLRRHLGW